MSRTKIAPTLTGLFADLKYLNRDSPGDIQVLRVAEAEFRAMASAVRAAEVHSHAEVPYDPVSEERFCSICRALARLRRVSGGARTTKGGAR